MGLEGEGSGGEGEGSGGEGEGSWVKGEGSGDWLSLLFHMNMLGYTQYSLIIPFSKGKMLVSTSSFNVKL